MKRILQICALSCFCITATSQVAINTDASLPHASAILDVQSTTKGALLPRMTWTEIQGIANPAMGLLVFDTGIKTYRMYNGKSWVILGVKEFELTDPPGVFSHYVTTGSGIAIAEDVTMGADGSVYITGFFSLQIDFGGITMNSLGTYDAYFAKYTSSGNLVWIKQLSGPATNAPQHIELDATGNIYVCGNFQTSIDLDPGTGVDNHVSTGGADLFFAKYNANGDLIWGRHLGGVSSEVAYSLRGDPAGNIYLCGSFTGTADFDPGAGVSNLTSAGGSDIFFAGYNSSGNLIFARSMGSVSDDYGYDLLISGGNLVVTGFFTGTVDFDPSGGITNLTSVGGSDVFFAKYDVSGNLVWARGIGGSGSDAGNALAADATGNIWITGYSLDGTTDMDFDPGAGVVTPLHHGSYDAFIAKYNSAGNYVFGGYLGGTSSDSGEDISTDVVGNIYVAGTYYPSADFDPAGPVFSIPNYGTSDIFIAKYSSTGVLQWVKGTGGAGSDQARAVAVSADGKMVFVTGSLTSNPYMSFNGERVYNTNYFYLARYEE